MKNSDNNINIVSKIKDNDVLYKIKDKNYLKNIDNENKVLQAEDKKIIINNLGSIDDNDLSSELNVSDSKSGKESNKSINNNDKTIEIPQIKFNSALMYSNNDETENDISSN